jgi:hypothetical protein
MPLPEQMAYITPTTFTPARYCIFHPVRDITITLTTITGTTTNRIIVIDITTTTNGNLIIPTTITGTTTITNVAGGNATSILDTIGTADMPTISGK